MSSIIAKRAVLFASLLTALLLTVLLPNAAHAQSDKAAAESLFLAGKAQMDAGDFAGACKSFGDSQRLDASVGTLLNLALCNEKQGKTATAWATYKEAAQLARIRSDPGRETAASDFAKALEPKLSRLTVTAKEPVPGLVVRRDGADVGGLGVALAIDPGEHTIEAAAPGYTTWSTKVTIGAEKDQQTLEIPPLVAAPPGTEEPKPGDPLPPGFEATEGDGDGTGLKIAGFVIGGVGVVGIVLGAAFGGIASSTASGAEDDPSLCPQKVCSDAGRAEIDSAETQATISTVGFIAGGVALAGGVVLVVLGYTVGDAGSSDEATAELAPGLTVRPWFRDVGSVSAQPASGGVFGVEGSF
jgi:hypothetical protein